MDVNNDSIQINLLSQKRPCLHANETRQPTVYVGTEYFMEAWSGVELWSGAENYIKTKPVKRYFGYDC